jgi:hypothetical protein
MQSHRRVFVVLFGLLVQVVLTGKSHAIPAFSRQYGKAIDMSAQPGIQFFAGTPPPHRLYRSDGF